MDVDLKRKLVDGEEFYNFVRPHRALKFGGEMRTPAMQAGLATRRLRLREIFPSAKVLWISEKSQVRTIDPLVIVDETPMPLVA